MRIVHLTWLLSNAGGGVPPVVAALAREQRRAGHEAFIAGVEDPRGGPLVPSDLPLVLGKVVGPLALGFAPGLASRIDALGPEILHLHGLFTWSSQIAKQWSKRRKRPLVISPHGMVEPWALRNSAWKKRAFRAFIENGNLAQATCIHALCPEEARDAMALGLGSPIAVVPNGFDAASVPRGTSPSEFRRILPEIGDRRVVLYLGRVHPKKGLMPLLDAWGRLNDGKRAVENSWVLVIGGPEQKRFLAELRARARTLGVEQSVVIPGGLYGDDKAAALAGSDIFVLPSFSEGIPMALLEAMAWGLPVLASRRCNVDVEASGAGRLCDPESSSISEALASLMAMTGQERTALGNRGRRDVETRYAWSEVARDVLSVYAWILGSGPRPACIWP
jgi:poly(glycerol-phosphate) alpha-glucosyltransferase